MGWGLDGYAYVDESTGICNFAMYPVLINEPATPPVSCGPDDF